jgi:hypothetical protein
MPLQVYWGELSPVMSGAQRVEADALYMGHEIVLTAILRSINSAAFDVELRAFHGQRLEQILRRDERFFSFVEAACITLAVSPEANEPEWGEGVQVIKLMLASSRGWPLGPQPGSGAMRQRSRIEYQRIFGV